LFERKAGFQNRRIFFGYQFWLILFWLFAQVSFFGISYDLQRLLINQHFGKSSFWLLCVKVGRDGGVVFFLPSFW